MSVETTTMSSKGQVVIPSKVREAVEAEEGAVFAATGSGDTVILKKIETPDEDELIDDMEEFAANAKEQLQERGLDEEDVKNV